MINTTNISSGTVMVTLQVVPALWGLGGGEPGPALWGRADGKISFPKAAFVHNLTISRAGIRLSEHVADTDGVAVFQQACVMKRSIKRRRKRAAWDPQYLLDILGPLQPKPC
jgi:hypothetical protein